MTPAGWFFLFLVIAVPTFLVLEGRRQRRREAERRSNGNATKLARAGLLELQSVLEPDRKIEVFREEKTDAEEDDAGSPPSPEEKARRMAERTKRAGAAAFLA